MAGHAVATVSLIFIIVAAFSGVSQSARILGIFHFPVRSQHVLGSYLLKELAARGHDVTMISPFPLKKPVANYTDIMVDNGLLTYMQKNFGKQLSGQKLNIIQRLQMSPTYYQDFGELFLESKEIKDLLKSGEKFDLVIQLMLMNEATLGIGHHFNAPTIPFFTTGPSSLTNHIFGNVAPYSMVPTIFTSSIESFCDRVMNAFTGFSLEMITRFQSLPRQERLLKKHFPNAPSLQTLLDDVHIGLFNSHPAIEGSKPYMPNMIPIGGFYIEKPDFVLCNNLHKFFADANDGVIYFSLGTNVRSDTFPKEKIDIFLRVFGKLKQKVILRIDGKIENAPDNVFVGDWLPQSDILAHEKTKLFVTHAGLGGVAESIYHAVPMLCIPFVSDQPKNCEDLVRNGYGARLDIDDLTEENFYNAVVNAIANPSYGKNLLAASDFYKSQPLNPLDLAIYWVEHVIKHKGAKHFPKSIATKQSLVEYLLLDIIGVAAAILLLALLLLRAILRIVLIAFCKKTKTQTTVTSKKKKQKKN